MVHLTVLTYFLATFSLLCAAAPATHQKAHHGQKHGMSKALNKTISSMNVTTAKAVYFLSNDAQNSVVALKIMPDGTLAEGSITPTGGKGGNGIDASKNASAAPDALFSQGALTVGGCNLFAVNAGSNTLTGFQIDDTDPTKLTPIGDPVDTLGEFPVSVAFSQEINQACVVNGGAIAGVACYNVDNEALTPNSLLRPFNISQTTPPVGPLGTVSHIFFNSESTALITTVKGNPMTGTAGFLSVFPITEGNQIATQDVQSAPSGTKVLFGSQNIGPNMILSTDAAFGAAIISIDPTTSIGTTLATTNITDQKATCWAAFSKTTNTTFVSDVGVNHVVEIDGMGNILEDLQLTNGNPGLIDLAVGGSFVYALSPGNGGNATTAVTVLDISGGRGSAKEIQNFKVSGAGVNSQGLQVFV
jgi:hypothetical protein